MTSMMPVDRRVRLTCDQSPRNRSRSAIHGCDMLQQVHTQALNIFKRPIRLGPRPSLFTRHRPGESAAVGPALRKRAVWVVAPAAGIHGKLMENALPTFWSDALSRAFADTRPGIASASPDGPRAGGGVIRRADPPNVDELRLRARQLRAAGYSYGEIAKMLGISKTRAYRLVNER